GRVLRGLLFSAIMLALFSFPALAKTPRIHAIVGARIVVAPGQVIEGGTIVMRDGVITAVGGGVPVPADARVWEGDSLTVYPGLIDAFVLPAEAPAAAGPQGPPGREGYPGSLMGAIAVIRQAFLDAKWYRDALAAYARAPHGVERPETNLAWEALQTVIGGKQPALFVADEMLEVLRAATIAREAG